MEIIPQNLITLNDPDKLASFIDGFQSAVASFAATLKSAGLALAGPSVVTDTNLHDNVPILRVGVWLLPPTFPFAPQDPQHPHQLPLLTPADAALGFSQAQKIGVVITTLGGAGFALSIPMTTFNTLATALALPKIQAKAAKIGATVSSVTVTSSSPSPLGEVGGNVVATIEGSIGVPPAGFSGTITETLGLMPDILPGTIGTMVPTVSGIAFSHTDVGNQVLAGAAAILGGSDLLGTGFFIEALGITVFGQLGLTPALGSGAALITALVNMLPPEVPFEPGQPNDIVPDFPKLIFNWSAFVATSSEIMGRATVTVVGRPAGSAIVTLSGPAALAGSQSDIAADGAAATYTVTWRDIFPQSFGWQVTAPAGNSDGGLSGMTFPFQQEFTADFPIPDPMRPGQYRFDLAVTATEVDVRDPNVTLTASARQEVVVHVVRDPPPNKR